MPPTDGEVAMVDGNSTVAMAANDAVSVPFTCNFCQRSFPRLSLLKKHEQVTLVCQFQIKTTQSKHLRNAPHL